MAVHWTVGCDAHDPQRLAAFWALALDYVLEAGFEDDPDAASIVDPAGIGPAIGWLRVPEPKAAKNRVHLDIRVAGEPPWEMTERAVLIRDKVAQLVGAGGVEVREEHYSDDSGRTALGHVVMLDPEGNEFCVA